MVDGWTPEALPSSVPHVETVFGSIGGYEVKGYVVHDRGEAVVVDTAYNASGMLALLAQRKLRLRAICLTHGHSDHAEGIEAILRAYPVPVYLALTISISELAAIAAGVACAAGRRDAAGRRADDPVHAHTGPYTGRGLLPS